jgi:exopolyphosphatase/guanosine-5'-triphosphate,3'-diphosphate pyrophosphatase
MPPERFAAIDLGTNTILLLIAELRANGSFEVLEDRAEITRLGEGVDRTGRIGPEGEKRSFEVLKAYLARCRALSAGEVVAVGTSALRDAENAGAFLRRLRAERGLELRVLSGEEEARYSCLAIARGLGLKEKRLLVVDVGGGSTEIISSAGSAGRRWVSLDLGSVRLTERYLRSDPVKEDEVRELVAAVDRGLERLGEQWLREPVDVVVGVAGTFTTLVAIERRLERYSHSEVHGSRLSRAEVRRQIRLFQEKTLAERKKIRGLEPRRADVILGGALLIDRIMDLFGVGEVIVSDQGVRYGFLYEKLVGRHG